jgi:hypothetical protein
MKYYLKAIAMVLAIPFILAGQATFAGKWQAELPVVTGIDIVTMELKMSSDSNKIAGTISRSAQPERLPEPFEGKVTNDTISFTIQSPDGKRVVAFNGKLMGDQIVFARKVTGTGGGKGIYGAEGPDSFTVRRLN